MAAAVTPDTTPAHNAIPPADDAVVHDAVVSPERRVGSVGAGVVEAFAQMYRREYPRVLGYLIRRCADVSVAEECAAETFTIAWQKVDDAEAHPGWLFVTARNVLANRGRAELKLMHLHEHLAEATRRGLVPSTIPGPDVVGEHHHNLPLYQAMDRLPAAQRDLLIAHYWDGLSGGECAHLAGCTVSAVWVRLHRARRALAGLLRNPNEPSNS